MSNIRKGRRAKGFKLKIALEAIKGEKTVNQIAEEFAIHPNQVSEWKKQLLERGDEIFEAKAEMSVKTVVKEREQLMTTIGMQQVKIDFLKKKLGILNSGYGEP